MSYTKESVMALKNEIKSLSANQKVLKNQRKTIHLIGERTIAPDLATMRHKFNRYSLRYLYIAYGFMRGKTIEQIEGVKHGEFSVKKVNEIIAKYGEVVCNNEE